MEKYDVAVIGSGCGMIIADEALGHGLKVAVVDKGPLGGTCLNLGCIPSKMLIYVADRAVEIQEAGKLGIEAEMKSIDFGSIMERMRKSIKESRDQIREGIARTENLRFYEGEGHFVADYTIEVNGHRIKADKVLLASGSRPLIPSIKGIDTVDYLTNETTLQLEEKPESLIIVGGGYIAVEYGHFFAAMGTRVTILEMADRLVLSEEPEISELLRKQLSRRMEVYTGAMAEEIKKNGDSVAVMVKTRDGQSSEFAAQRILVAVGRRSNADLLKPENSGVETDQKGFIKVDDYFETTKKNIFAPGDANGRAMFRHAANRQAALVADNVLHGSRTKFDYVAVPHAVYSHPQISSVGLTEEVARKNHKILVGMAGYFDVAKGEAMKEDAGFAKVIVDRNSQKLLGFHIVGPFAPELIQEVTNAMASGGRIDYITKGMHIHPALNELIEAALGNLEEA